MEIYIFKRTSSKEESW